MVLVTSDGYNEVLFPLRPIGDPRNGKRVIAVHKRRMSRFDGDRGKYNWPAAYYGFKSVFNWIGLEEYEMSRTLLKKPLLSAACVLIAQGAFADTDISEPQKGKSYQRQIEMWYEHAGRMEEQRKETARQLTESARLQVLTEKQLEKSMSQAERMDRLLDRWEAQADRYDRLLEKWSSQAGR